MHENKLKRKPLVSIILPVYNGEKFLARSIESCLNQTYQNLELIIVYDSSTDNSLEIIRSHANKDSRIKIINNVEKKNLPAGLNIGHYVAKGDFVTWTSDDNIFETIAIEEMSKKLCENDIDVVYCDMVIIDHNGEKVRDFVFLDLENIIFRNYIGNCFLYKKEVFERNKGYDENCFLVEDYDFWLRAIAHSRFYQLRKKLYRYRKHDSSLTHQIAVDNEKKQIFNESVIKMYDSFSKTLLEKDYLIIREFLSKSLTYQKITFKWIIDNESVINEFKQQLSHNINFQNKNTIEKVFLNKIVHLMVLDQGTKTNLSKSFYIVKKYGFFLDKKAIKTLIKYSFFKK
ncbi:glycosyltransferase [Flavobacterium sp. 120]|uniref:glycosyltransferase family 2 protein n=1 Tax=Flavobacterium sp. 120 TaxID=2135626 RepID=UPI000EADE6D4|nr:glycosyltransferase [Flavobacterium sp. 120]RKS13352.1 glycosyl transferase family 2 [Flavobacterium sp. 120]